MWKAKYIFFSLFQLFDKDNILNRKALHYLFTTEGHVLYLDPAYRTRPWEEQEDDKEDEEESGDSMAVARPNDSFIGHSVSSVCAQILDYFKLQRNENVD